MRVMSCFILICLCCSSPADEIQDAMLIAGAYWPEHLEPIVERAESLQPEVRKQLIDRLAEMNMPGSIPLMQHIGKTSDKQTDHLFKKLTTMTHSRAIDAIVDAWDNWPENDRWRFIDQLSEPASHYKCLGHPGMRRLCQTRMESGDALTAFRYAAALYHIGHDQERSQALHILNAIDLPQPNPKNRFRHSSLRRKLHKYRAAAGNPRVWNQLHEVLADDQRRWELDDALENCATAIKNGAKLNQTSKQVLLQLVNKQENSSIARLAVSVLAASTDASVYQPLMTALPTSPIKAAIIDALWKLDAKQAKKDLSDHLRRGGELSSLIVKTATEHPSLQDSLQWLLDNTTTELPKELPEEKTSLRSDALRALLHIRFPHPKQRPAKRRYLESYLQHDDPALAAHALRVWTGTGPEPIPDDLLPRVRNWLTNDNVHVRLDAHETVYLRHKQFRDDILTLLNKNTWTPGMVDMMPLLCAGKLGLSNERTLKLIHQNRKHTGFDQGFYYYSELFTLHPAAPDFVDLITKNIPATDKSSFFGELSLAARYGNGVTLSRILSYCQDKPQLSAKLLSSITHRAPLKYQSEALTNWLYTTHTIPGGSIMHVVQAFNTHRIDKPERGSAAILYKGKTFLAEKARDYLHAITTKNDISNKRREWQEFRDCFITLRKRWNKPYDADRIVSKLTAGAPAERLIACAQLDATEEHTLRIPIVVERLRQRLWYLASQDQPALRVAALKAITPFLTKDDSPRLLQLLHAGSHLERETALDTLFTSDPITASQFAISQHDQLLQWAIFKQFRSIEWFWNRDTPACRLYAIRLLREDPELEALLVQHCPEATKRDDFVHALLLKILADRKALGPAYYDLYSATTLATVIRFKLFDLPHVAE